MLLTQVNKTITIFEEKYPEAQGLFTFDHAPSHTKKPGDSLTKAHKENHMHSHKRRTSFMVFIPPILAGNYRNDEERRKTVNAYNQQL